MKRTRRSGMRFHPLVFVLLAALLPPSGCSEKSVDVDRTPLPASGALVLVSECKSGAMGLGHEAAPNLDCVTWEYDGEGALGIVHVNAALNCCPGTITADIDIDGNSIIISEREGEDGVPCRCLCLYDLEYEITGIPAGQYDVTFVEAYLGEGAEPLTVTFDLEAEPEGTHCVVREEYPWGEEYSGTEPVGVVTSHGTCKSFGEGEDIAAPRTQWDDPALTCVFVAYWHDIPYGKLALYHSNAAFNCCVDSIDAGFSFGTGIIEITEREIPEGGLCDCLCLYDVGYTIFNVEPGEYTIRIVEPYLPQDAEEIQFTVDLSETKTFVRCFVRTSYPWGTGGGEDEDRLILRRLYDAIVSYIGTPYCSDCAECRAIGVGAKPCGGPWEYLVYSAATLDEQVLRELVGAHHDFEEYLNRKYRYSSTCDVPPVPRPVCALGICRAAQ